MKIETKEFVNKTFPVFSQKLAGYLMIKGFVLVDMKPSHMYERRNVFFFKSSSQIDTVIKDYINNR